MNITTVPKTRKLVSHSQYVTWCVAVKNAILASEAHGALKNVVVEPTKPMSMEELVVTGTDLQAYVADMAYLRFWRDK